eukprot:2568683-Prymnesium_polylepis.1
MELRLSILATLHRCAFAAPADVGGSLQHRGCHVDAGGRWRRPDRACVSDLARTDRPRPSERRRHPSPVRNRTRTWQERASAMKPVGGATPFFAW